MFFKLKFLIALAIFVILTKCKAKELKDPNTFIQDSFAVLNTLKAECQHIDDILENISLDQDDNLNKFKNCGNKLLEISKAASTYDLSKIENIETKQTINLLRNIGVRYKLGEDIEKLSENLMQINKGDKAADIENYDDSDITYTLDEILKGKFVIRSEDINEINYYWSNVADKVGALTAENFFPFIELIKEKAKEYNLTAAEFWYPGYSEKTMTDIDNFIKKLKPLYQQLHAYIRFKLFNRYGRGVIKKHGPISEPLYQQVEDRVWSTTNFYESDFPLSDIPNFDQIFDTYHLRARDLFRYAERYYESLGIENFDHKYEKEHLKFNADDNCTEDFNDREPNNVTLTYCGYVNFALSLDYSEYYGRIYNAISQKDAPWLFWGDNFYGKIIGRAVKLASQTKNYQGELRFGVPDDVSDNWMSTQNINMAFMEVFSMMRRYVNLRVVIDLLENKVDKVAVNEHYWTLFEEHAGVEPPVNRTAESLDLPYTLIRDVFDNRNLIRDFDIDVHKFEVYAAACHLAEHTGPLNECKFSYDKKVGEAFKQILSTGLKKPFSKTIEPLIPNYKHLNAQAVLAYFQPAFQRIKRFNRKHGLMPGWHHTKKILNEKPLTNDDEVAAFVEESSQKIYKLYDQIASQIFEMKIEGSEDYDSDFFGEYFWQDSEAAEAAKKLTQISKKAKQYEKMKIKSKPLKKAISKLAKIADVFVLGNDVEKLLSNKKELQNTSIKDDIIKYKDTSEHPATVAYNPYILNVFKTSFDANELKHYWESWRARNNYYAENLMMEIFTSLRKAANILEISTTEFWYKHYSNDYIKEMEKVIETVKPFYHQLHYYVSQNLLRKYSEDQFSKPYRSIPDHLMQQVLAQIWTNESVVEYNFLWKNLPPQEQGVANKKYDAIKLLQISEEFYRSLGFEPLEDTFWHKRVKVQEDSANDIDCHATLIDMTPKVYMKYCERVSFKKLLQAHGYLGQVRYAVEKKDLPSYYFDSYDFEYPVGEAAILSAGSPKHVEKIGLISGFEVTDEVLLNRMIRMAIHTLFNLHKYFVHTKVIDEYLRGKLKDDDINKRYWELMISYAGIEPPNDRHENRWDFPFEFYTDLEQNHQVRKFTSEILGYRIYERLCNLSGHKGDLNNCDFSGSIEAGNALKSMMKLGSSLPRKTVLKRFLEDTSDLDAKSMLAYYEPLAKWLQDTLKDTYRDKVPTSFDSARKSVSTEYFVI